MRTFDKQAAQGDLYIRRIDSVPGDTNKQESGDEYIVVAHSETGHHHTVPSSNAVLFTSSNPLISFVVVTGEAELKHHRSFDRHESLRLREGVYEFRRQQEYTPKGWRRVED